MYHWVMAVVCYLNYSIVTKNWFWKHQDLTWKERNIMILLWNYLVDSLCQHLDINPHSHRDWENTVMQTSSTYISKGLEDSVTTAIQILRQTLEGGDIMFLQAGPCSLTDVFYWGLSQWTGICYVSFHVCVCDWTCAKFCWYRTSPICPMCHV